MTSETHRFNLPASARYVACSFAFKGLLSDAVFATSEGVVEMSWVKRFFQWGE